MPKHETIRLIVTLDGATQEEVQKAGEAAMAVFAQAGVTPYDAAAAAFAREGWDLSEYARIETADTSGAFKDAWKSKRCLVPADGFYEWTKNADDGGRDPWFIHLPETQPFSFAGLWAHNDKLGVTSCTIITMPAAEPMTQLHDRQPAILAPDAYDAWLDPATPAGEVKPLLGRNLDGQLEFHRVDRKVNASSRADKPNDAAAMIGLVNPL